MIGELKSKRREEGAIKRGWEKGKTEEGAEEGVFNDDIVGGASVPRLKLLAK